MLRCGLLGRKLGHSYSPQIHKMLKDYEYLLYEREEEDIPSFLHSTFWTGLNVTIPYKKTVIPFLDEVSDTVKRTGSANTLVRRRDGAIYGDNTDVYGFTQLVYYSGIDVKGKKTLILGSGGACASVLASLEDLGAKPLIISRSGENNYENLYLHYDAEIIVNTTPLGMYPNNGVSPVDLSKFPKCCGVFDLIYNPSKTALLLQAEKLGIPSENGLFMLVAQAKRSSEQFVSEGIPDSETTRIYSSLQISMKNIVLIGMPGCGKSTIAKMLGEATGRNIFDSDAEILRRTGMKPSEIITQKGEKAFRDIECEVIAEIGKESHSIIATGGGVITREENYNSLHQNGIILWLKRDVSALPLDDRPLSQIKSPAVLYKERKPLYEKFADITIEISDDKNVTYKLITDALKTYREEKR